MKCPICKKEFEDMKYRPFCSKRCADIDLGNWFSGKYSVPLEEMEDAEWEELNDELNKQEGGDC